MSTLGDMFAVLNLPCRTHAELLTRELDEPLSRGTRWGLAIHLLYCTGCKRLRAQLRRLKELSRSLANAPEAGEPMPPAARERIVESLRGKM